MKRCQEEFKRFLEIPEISDYTDMSQKPRKICVIIFLNLRNHLWRFILPDRPF
jgi:hypothetical protein